METNEVTELLIEVVDDVPKRCFHANIPFGEKARHLLAQFHLGDPDSGKAMIFAGQK